jgi:hypothetical protein
MKIYIKIPGSKPRPKCTIDFSLFVDRYKKYKVSGTDSKIELGFKINAMLLLIPNIVN